MKDKQISKLELAVEPVWTAEPAKGGQVAESENVFEQIPKANPENESDKDKPKAKIYKQSEQIQELEHFSLSSSSLPDADNIDEPTAKVKSRLQTPTKTESEVEEVTEVHRIRGNDPRSLAELGNPSPNTDSPATGKKALPKKPIVQTKPSKPTVEPTGEPKDDEEEKEEEEE